MAHFIVSLFNKIAILFYSSFAQQKKKGRWGDDEDLRQNSELTFKKS